MSIVQGRHSFVYVYHPFTHLKWLNIDIHQLAWMFVNYRIWDQFWAPCLYAHGQVCTTVEKNSQGNWRLAMQGSKVWRPPLPTPPNRIFRQTKRDSTTTFSRFQNQNHAIPEPNHAIPQPKPARFHNYILTISQPHSHDSTTKLPRFHNQNLRIPQPNSHDSTTNISGFHNQNLATLQLTTIDSTRKTAATYFHCRKFLTSYKKLKSPTPAKQ